MRSNKAVSDYPQMVAGSMDRGAGLQSRAQKVQKQEQLEEINKKQNRGQSTTVQARGSGG
jgi:hypothetical protein